MKIDVNTKGLALLTQGISAKDTVSGLGLLSFGLIWPLWAGWVSPYSSVGATVIATTWSVAGLTATTSWTSLGMTSSTTWTPYDTIPSDP